MVKSNWDTEELIENWTLLPTELELVRNKVGGNQIGFALLLKHFQIFTCFPDEKSSIPQIIISYIANQLKIPESSYSDYDWQGRTAKVYRVEIRRLFNFRVATVQDSVEMSDWLIKEVLPHEQKFESLVESVYQRWRELQIEPPTSGRIERLIRSAISQYESEFCYHTLSVLSKENLAEIDILLTTEHSLNAEEKQDSLKLKTSDFAFLKTDPGPVGLESFLTEIEKLKRIRGIGLPLDLFKGISPKLIKTYRHRAATETPYLLRQHPPAIRLPHIWGEGTTTCASDSKHFGAWDQNLLTQYHLRYGGRGVMIYWHVEKKSTCIYSQLKTCSSSEVAAMIEGVLRHCTNMNVQKNYVDSHGQSEVAFAFTHLLGFQLMPRLKRIKVQKLYRPYVGQSDAYPNLQPILTRPINWDLIRQQYDQMVKFTTALKLGTAETQA
jgi:hypothetical protein